MKKIFFLATAMTAMLATSCSNEDNASIEDNSGKTRIALSAGDNGEVAKTRAGFTDQTRIVARIVSDKRGGGDAKCVITNLSAAAELTTGTYSIVSYVTDNTRYWDDAYGRSSILSVYAIAIPNKYDNTVDNKLDNSNIKGTSTWATDNASDNNITWSVATTQTTTTLTDEDLAYSNNIQKTGKKGVYTWDYSASKYPEEGPNNASQHGTDPTDGRLYFTQSDDYTADLTDNPGHFDKGQMEFNHALTRIQVNLIKGEGFTSAPFSVTDMQILGQSASGTFNIKDAAWTSKDAATPIQMAVLDTKADKAATYEAQMLPGYAFVENSITNIIQMTVDGNTYFITSGMLYTAMQTKGLSDFTTAMGNRYMFDITVAKNKIQNVTATLIPWNDIDAGSTNVDNSHHTFTFYGSGSGEENKCKDVKLWKYEQNLSNAALDGSYTTAPAVANTAYTAVAGFAPVSSGSSIYTTSEYYNDNKTAYHFRSTNATTALDAGAITFTMNSGNTDYHWGAPMKTGLSSNKLPYSNTNGYLNCIEKGIVAASTTSNINLTEVHMMSKLVIKLTSNPLEGQSGDAKVTLSGAKVTITKLSNSGTVDMGSGLITPTATYNNSSELTVAENEGVYSCEINVVPQTLKRNGGTSDDDYVGITIKTTDNNEYYIVKRLSEIQGTAGSQITNMQTNNGYITDWYPGHKYIYTFNITKTEIKNITATIVGWNEVNAGNTNLDLEK